MPGLFFFLVEIVKTTLAKYIKNRTRNIKCKMGSAG